MRNVFCGWFTLSGDQNDNEDDGELIDGRVPSCKTYLQRLMLH